MITEDADQNIQLKPSLQVYLAASRYLLITRWDPEQPSDEHRERFESLCRYLLHSLDSESPKLSYIGVALNREHSAAWIRHIKQLLLLCCTLMDSLKPETHRDTLSLGLMLTTLMRFTCPSSWAVLKKLSAMKPAMQQYCNNIIGFLILKGFFLSLRVSDLDELVNAFVQLFFL